MKRALLVLVVLGCGSSGNAVGGVSARLDGANVVLDGDVALRALRVELAWDGTGVVAAGADATRMNLVRTLAHDGGMSVLITDTRRLQLPKRGNVLTVTGATNVRLISAEGVAEDPGAAPRDVAVSMEGAE